MRWDVGSGDAAQSWNVRRGARLSLSGSGSRGLGESSSSQGEEVLGEKAFPLSSLSPSGPQDFRWAGPAVHTELRSASESYKHEGQCYCSFFT